MFSVPDKLFYVRELQLKFYFNKNKSVKALFFLEKFLFENYKFQEEIPLTVLKQKWIYECRNVFRKKRLNYTKFSNTSKRNI